MKQSGIEPTLKVTARAPFEVYYEGPAQVVSAANAIGQFDILPRHADFFSILVPCEVTIDPGSTEPLRFNISDGILAVRDDEVLLFCNM